VLGLRGERWKDGVLISNGSQGEKAGMSERVSSICIARIVVLVKLLRSLLYMRQDMVMSFALVRDYPGR
jgi:hypothetical protein